MEQIADKKNLYRAYSKALCGKRAKAEVMAYGRDVLKHIDKLGNQLLHEKWRIGDYHYFRIFDPKERLICAASFSERVLHHAIMNICHPYFDKQLIEETYATRIGKGTYAAIERARVGARKYRYVVKLDVRKYFDSIDHQILKGLLRKLFKDGALLHLFDDIIDSYESQLGKGLPIGNLTSQYFANCYLSPIDHYIKEHLRVPIYVRYMDDILIFGNTKEEIKQKTEQIIMKMEEIKLKIKPPLILRVEQGVPFLGYRVYPHKLLLSGRSKRRFEHKYNIINKLFERNIISEQEYIMRILPLLAYIQKAYTKQYRLTILGRTA